MRGKRVFFVLIITVVLVFGWLFTLKSASGIDEINEQKQLVNQAETYLDKKLYVRGIPLLEQAILFKTKHSPDIQRQLLNAYWNYGDMDSYYNMVQVMDSNDSNRLAKAEDYIILAKYYLENGDELDALKVVITGQKMHPDPGLEELYEQCRYSYFVCDMVSVK